MTTLDDIIGRSQHDSLFSRIKRLPAFWVFTAALLACLALTLMTDTFASERNLFNVARNFAFVAIIAIGMTAVIASGGIDLSVGSSVVLSAMVISVAMSSGLPFWISAILALGAALAVGLFNGILIAYAGHAGVCRHTRDLVGCTLAGHGPVGQQDDLGVRTRP
jgi:ribose transport system permease protein